MAAQIANAAAAGGKVGVRFDDAPPEEIEAASPQMRATERDDVPPEVQQELRDLSETLQKSRLHHERMEKFAFEPVSLPSSRAPSPSASSRSASRVQSARDSPIVSPSIAAAHGQTPPLTPAGSRSLEGKINRRHGSSPNLAKSPDVITPQISPPHRGRASGSAPNSRQASPPASRPAITDVVRSSGRRTRFTLGPSSRSQPPSRDPSPGSRPDSSSTTLNAPSTKARDGEAGAARANRAPQNSAGIDPRFIFSKEAKQGGAYPTTTKSSANSSDSRTQKGSIFSAWYTPDTNSHEKHERHGSMHDLKRFFKFGGKHHREKHSKSNESDRKRHDKSGASTPPQRQASQGAIPFADDHGLESKYGKFGKVLGSGAGGSVRLMKRSSDGVTFAVKQFRARHPHESEREYNKKVTAEFCIGSTLHDGNIIETMDIIQEKGNWYEVMEYAPYDLFAIVMTGKMSREEVTCDFMQIVSGVSYLHSMGLAHRDLKLDNVVVNEYGIMKIIDFGSAVVFRYPFEDENVKASGIVGSDPYLAPEVYEESKYDAQAVDIWSLAIIYCCMTLRRFPWKMPRQTDTSFKLFVSPPTPGTPSIDSLRRPSEGHARVSTDGHRPASVHSGTSTPPTEKTGDTAKDKDAPPQTIKGPWRLLRLLPRESRFIIGRMLDTNPETRATLDDMHADHWMSTRPYCKQEAGGNVIRAEGHTHTLEPSAPPANKDKDKDGSAKK